MQYIQLIDKPKVRLNLSTGMPHIDTVSALNRANKGLYHAHRSKKTVLRKDQQSVVWLDECFQALNLGQVS